MFSFATELLFEWYYLRNYELGMYVEATVSVNMFLSIICNFTKFGVFIIICMVGVYWFLLD